MPPIPSLHQRICKFCPRHAISFAHLIPDTYEISSHCSVLHRLTHVSRANIDPKRIPGPSTCRNSNIGSTSHHVLLLNSSFRRACFQLKLCLLPTASAFCHILCNCFCILIVFAARTFDCCWSRVVNRSVGSPIFAVAPPTSVTVWYPCKYIQNNGIRGSKCPTCKEEAVGSNPTYTPNWRSVIALSTSSRVLIKLLALVRPHDRKSSPSEILHQPALLKDGEHTFLLAWPYPLCSFRPGVFIGGQLAHTSSRVALEWTLV